MITVLYVALVFGLYVSNWEFKVKISNSYLSIPSNLVEAKTVRNESLICSNYFFEISLLRAV
jgi:hypothetical protein